MNNKLEMSTRNLIGSVVIAGAIRYLLIVSKYATLIRNRVEVSTPLNSWNRCNFKIKYIFFLKYLQKYFTVQEGAYLYHAGINPYSGDMYHENPLILVASSFLIKHFSSFIPFLFILMDLTTATLLYQMAKRFVKEMVILKLIVTRTKIDNKCKYFVCSMTRNNLMLKRNFILKELKNYILPKMIQMKSQFMFS